MSKTAQRILVILVATITAFCILSYFRLREIRNYAVLADGWFTELDYQLNRIERDVDSISILWGGWSSTEFPQMVSNSIFDIEYSVDKIYDILSGINNWRVDFTTLYLNANYNSLKWYLNTVKK